MKLKILAYFILMKIKKNMYQGLEKEYYFQLKIFLVIQLLLEEEF